MNGTIVTFYSYKGGVGRSMALANVAVILARWGARVLCLDWDLEAPGLHEYFAELSKPGSSKCGLLGLLQAVHGSDKSIAWQEATERLDSSSLGSKQGQLDFIRAGAIQSCALNDVAAEEMQECYIRAVQAIDWGDLFTRHHLGEKLEKVRNEWKSTYDFVLVDSRTGLTDIGGICAIHLPDILVIFTTLNSQCLSGAVSVAKSAEAGRSRLPFDRSRLLVLPVLSRVDARVERDLSFKWHERAAQILGPLVAPWSHRTVSPSELLTVLRIPYIPSLSYGEKLVVLEESTRDSESAAFAYEAIAALLAQGLGRTDALIAGRDRFVFSASLQIAAARDSEDQRALYDVLITSDRSDREFADRIAEELERRGLNVLVDPAESQQGASRIQTIEKHIAGSRNLLTIVGARGVKEPDLTTKLFLETAYEISTAQSTNSQIQIRRVIPLLRKGVPLSSSGFLGQFKVYREEDGIEDLVRELGGDIGPTIL